MAASLAVSRCLEDPDKWKGWVFDSAGIFAGAGSPATQEAVAAATRLGASLDRHASKPLTPEMIEEASTIYCLTQDHVRLVNSIAPDAVDKVHLLDPDGEDVDDPIGGTQDLYDQTALALDRMVRARLEELSS